MDSPQDRMLKTRYNRLGSGQFLGRQFQIPQYYFDSGAGIDYEVDVRKGLGERIKVLQMSNGEPFYEDKIYSVVVNTYRAHGAGGHMEVGAGIDQKEMRSRIISRDNTMIRELIHQKFIRQDEIMPFKLSNWRFVPESYVEVAKKREFDELLNR
jgi:2',3'-cyclic-nucleotide 2'-phosphodiesterase/3'-nucleotidase